MNYELYIDVLFLENFMMDSLLLLAVNRILKCGRAYGRIFLGGALGSALTCLVIAVPFPAVIKLIFFHFVINSVMLAAGLAIGSIVQFVKAFILLYLSAIILGGILQMFRPYIRYVSLFYAAAAVCFLVFSKVWSAAAALFRNGREILEVTVFADGKNYPLKALWDTGNVLTDPFTGEPVNILDPKTAEEIFGPAEQIRGFRIIPYRCVSGESIMKVFRAERMCIRKDGEAWVEAPLMGIGEGPLCECGEYQMILNPGTLAQ